LELEGERLVQCQVVVLPFFRAGIISAGPVRCQ
jgi:hypothetical protein